MPHQEPPRCSSEQRKANKTKEHPDHELANFHGDEQRKDTTQHNGGFQGWREFSHCALCDQIHFFRACGPNDWTAAGPSSQRIVSEKGMASQGLSARDDAQKDDDHGDHEEDMYEAAHRVGGHHPQQPENE